MNKNIKWLKKLKEFIKYGLAGGICTVVNLLLFVLLEKAGLHYILANIFSYFAAVMLNYTMSVRFVFTQGKERGKGKGLWRFLLIRAANLLADNLAFYFCVSLAGMPVYFSRVILTFLETIVTYCLMKRVVFK